MLSLKIDERSLKNFWNTTVQYGRPLKVPNPAGEGFTLHLATSPTTADVAVSGHEGEIVMVIGESEDIQVGDIVGLAVE